MFLKCPICGDNYSYDRKICQRCEDHSIISGLTLKGMNRIQKWNCGIFLKTTNSPFSKSSGPYVKIASEPILLNINKSEDLYWNCEEVRTFDSMNNSQMTSNMRDDTLLVTNSLKSQKRNINSSLIYE